MQIILTVMLIGIGLLLTDQDESGTKKQDVAAIVGRHPISIKRVERHLQKTLGKIKLSEPYQMKAKAEALEHLIRRHVVLESIRKAGVSAGPSEVLMEMTKLDDRLKEVDQSITDYLKKTGATKAELEYEFEWRIAWKKYLNKYLTSERLEKYFNERPRQFDGTEMKVAHLLIQSMDKGMAENMKTANSIRSEIVTGKISWNDAVKKYSDAKSSAADAGEIGWISYDGPMPEVFCQAAIKLQPDEISKPIETVFGLHLIKCLEIKSGKIGPRDAIDAVRDDATRSLFESLARQNRKSVPIEYKADWPKSESH